jgi:hypothetical protein
MPDSSGYERLVRRDLRSCPIHRARNFMPGSSDNFYVSSGATPDERPVSGQGPHTTINSDLLIGGKRLFNKWNL